MSNSMEETIIVIMERNLTTGFLDKEICSVKIVGNEQLLINACAVKNTQNASGYEVRLKLTTDRDVDDWEFDAIYDYYDEAAVIGGVSGASVSAVEDVYNPTWDVCFEYMDEPQAEQTIALILALHKKELVDVYLAIEDKKQDYITD